MSFFEGLRGWEIVAASGLCAVGMLSVATMIAVTFTLYVTRERAVAKAQSPVRPGAPEQPMYRAPVAAPAS